MASVLNPQQIFGGFGTSPQSCNITAPTSGNTLVIWVNSSIGGGLTGVTDNEGNTYTLDVDFGASDVRIYRCSNVTNAPTSIQLSWTSGSAQAAVRKVELSGLDPSPVGQTPAKVTGFGALSEVTLTTTTANEVGLAWLDINSNRAITPTGGATESPTSSASDRQYILYNADLGIIDSKTYGASWTTSESHSLYAITYKASSNGAVLMGQVCC